MVGCVKEAFAGRLCSRLSFVHVASVVQTIFDLYPTLSQTTPNL